MPTIKEHIEESMWNYPTLYGDDQYSIWRVLNHLFFVIGNGYEWENGEIVAIDFGDEDDLPRTQEQHNRGIHQWYWARKLRRGVNRFYGGSEYPVHFYQLSQYSMIVTMPPNVKDDYLLWGMRLLDFAADSPAEWYGERKDGRPPPEEYKLRIVEFREHFKDNWEIRLRRVLRQDWREGNNGEEKET